MRFEILGPMRLSGPHGEIGLAARRLRILLAMLLLHADQVVPAERLVDAIWGDRPPRDARNQLQACVSRLRKLLAGDAGAGGAIVTDPAGYRLRMGSHRLDLREFRRATAEARAHATAGRHRQAGECYRAGLGLWRGPALGGIDSEPVRRAARALDEERVLAWEECLEAELAAGAGPELVAELTELVREHPYREGLHGALMRALYRAGRHADALAVYRNLRRTLREELGTEPGAELRRLHRSILGHDPELDVPPAEPATAPPTPRELPPEPGSFVGRAAEITRLREALLSPSRPPCRRPVVVVLYGPGGVGKSALAVRVGHELAEHFPDGQLYVDLLGSTPRMRPLPPAEVLGRLLRSLGVRPPDIPSGELPATALFRSLTADRRLLLILDNAASRDQVAALIPNAPGCAVLVTSRRSLPTLDADERLRLDRLTDPEGVALLIGLTRGREVTQEAARRIVSFSGGLPLAVRIAAGRLVSRPDLPAHEYAARLADGSRRLDELELDDLAVRACIRTGYDALSCGGEPLAELAARAFRALGLLHVPDVQPGVVAAMLGEPDPERVRAALDRLVDAQLLESTGNGRYRLHDLVRLVAAECAAEEEPPAERDRILRYAIAYYTAGLHRAERTLQQNRCWMLGDPPLPAQASVPAFVEPSQARVWVDEERRNMAEALRQAVTAGGEAGRLALWLADGLWSRLDARCDWQLAHRMTKLMCDVAEGRADPELNACAWLLHGRSEASLGNYAQAIACLERATVAWRELENPIGVALALNGLGIVEARRGRPEESLTRYSQALGFVLRTPAEVRLTPPVVGLTARILGNMGPSFAVLGRLDEAAEVSKRSMSLCPVGSRTTLGVAMINLAAVHCLSGRWEEAVRCADQGVALHEDFGDRMRVCESLIIRSEAKRRLGRLVEAELDAELASSIAEVWGHRSAAAAAQSQHSRILRDLGEYVKAARARARADRAYAALAGSYQDPIIELLVGSASREPVRAPGGVLAASTRDDPAGG